LEIYFKNINIKLFETLMAYKSPFYVRDSHNPYRFGVLVGNQNLVFEDWFGKELAEKQGKPTYTGISENTAQFNPNNTMYAYDAPKMT